jgi:hypothetical protein
MPLGEFHGCHLRHVAREVKGSGMAGEHDAVLRLVSTPPRGFDPINATQRELLQYGFPPRPSGKAHPEILSIWRELASLPVVRQKPEFAELVNDTRDLEGRNTSPDDYIPHEWAGSVVFAPEGNFVTQVAGEWTIPNMVPGISHSGPDVCDQWIGIGGTGSSVPLQIGTTVQMPDLPRHFAWYQWRPNSRFRVDNLIVSPGDSIFCWIVGSRGRDARVYLRNRTRGTETSFWMQAPSGVTLHGNSAEWIVETPWWLSSYGCVYFDNGFALTNPAPDTNEAGVLVVGRGQAKNSGADHADSVARLYPPRCLQVCYVPRGGDGG